MFRKIKEKFVGFLKQGITPKQLAIAVALGICLGTVPVLGATSILCTIAAFSLRLNMATIQVVNYLLYPVQLLLYIPFLKAGAHISGKDFDYTLGELTTMLRQHPWETIQHLFVINMYALLLWALITAVAYGILYFILLKSFSRLAKVIHPNQEGSSPPSS